MSDLPSRLRALADDYPMSSRQIAIAESCAEEIEQNKLPWKAYQRARELIFEVTGEEERH